eukprot:9060804-Alexandrium_andersonii.AAC.1
MLSSALSSGFSWCIFFASRRKRSKISAFASSVNCRLPVTTKLPSVSSRLADSSVRRSNSSGSRRTA